MTPLERKVQELTCLYEVARSLSASLDIKATAGDVLGILGTVLGMTRGTLTLYDPATDDLVITAAYGLTPEEMARGRFKTGEGVTGAVFVSGEPMIVPDLGKESLFLNRTQSRPDLSQLALVAVPVQAQGQTLGVLSVDRVFLDLARQRDRTRERPVRPFDAMIRLALLLALLLTLTAD